MRNGNEESAREACPGFVIISEVIAPSLNLPEMIALLALSGAFVAPLPSRAARMAADDAPAPSDRYTMADPTGLLRSFFTGEKL